MVDKKIYIAGHRGMVGSAILRRLQSSGHTHLVTRTRQELDLLDQHAVRDFLKAERPDYIFLAAARVGGIHANNTYRTDFIYDTSPSRTTSSMVPSKPASATCASSAPAASTRETARSPSKKTTSSPARWNLRCHQARRHPAQATQRLARKSTRLAGRDRLARRH